METPTPFVVRASGLDAAGNSAGPLPKWHGPSGIACGVLSPAVNWLTRSYSPLPGTIPCEYRLVPIPDRTDWLRVIFVRELRRKGKK